MMLNTLSYWVLQENVYVLKCRFTSNMFYPEPSRKCVIFYHTLTSCETNIYPKLHIEYLFIMETSSSTKTWVWELWSLSLNQGFTRGCRLDKHKLRVLPPGVWLTYSLHFSEYNRTSAATCCLKVRLSVNHFMSGQTVSKKTCKHHLIMFMILMRFTQHAQCSQYVVSYSNMIFLIYEYKWKF